MEAYVELTNYGETIRGVLHLPEGEGPHPAVLFLHGLGGHRIEAHRLFVKAARNLAARGIGALRIDFRGAGESDGDAADQSLSSELSDARAAYAYLVQEARVEPKRLAVLGLSMGGAVAALLAGQLAGSDLPEPAALVLWAAVAELQSFFLPRLTPELKAQLEAGEPIVWGGEKLGPAFYRDVLHLKPLEAFRRYRGPVLVVHGEADETVPLDHARAWAQVRPDVETLLIPGASHTFGSPEAEGRVLEATARWLVTELLSTVR